MQDTRLKHFSDFCRMKYLLSILICFVFFSKVSAQGPNKDVEQKIDIVYTSKNNWEGRLDLYLPKLKSRNALLIYVHGGGWTHGKKEAEYEKFKVFIENGFAVANVEYRLAYQAPAPAAVEDVHCAIMYLLNNAKNFRIDPEKIILMGGSAGAHLALMAGLQSSNPVFTGDCGSGSFRVAAIISKYGPTDLLTWRPATAKESASSSWLGKHRTDTAFIKSMSPVNYVPGRKIPVLFIHGDQDKTVPINQSRVLYEKLKQYGYPTELYEIKDGKHGNFGDKETRKMNVKMLEFLSKHVR